MDDDPICLRLIPAEALQGLHRLVLWLKGAKSGPVVRLRQICRTEIHTALTAAGLARGFNMPEALRTHPHIAGLLG